jgi:amidophosphoribosyltransferase
MVVLQNGGMTTHRIWSGEPVKRSSCIFELIYFARPDSIVFGENVYQRRKNMGAQLAKEAPVEADFCMPFPDSGVYAAVGYAQASGLPYENAMIRNHYVGRTFIQPSQDMRDFGVRIKLNPVKEMIRGKRIVIIEDSIVRGTTIRTRIKNLRELGAKELHLRVSCPPIRHPCYYGIDFSSKGELIAANHSVEDIAEFIDLDSLHYLSVDGLLEAMDQNTNYCLACFEGDYPIHAGANCQKASLEG